jgi:hypothetical protein
VSSQATATSSTRAARLQLGLVSALCFIGLGAAVRPYGGFSSGDTVKVPGVGQRTPVELALLALRLASAAFALWLLVSIVASVVNLVRARSGAGAKRVAANSRSTANNNSNSAAKAAPRLFGPGWLQQLLRQAAGGTLALALLAGPASAVTRSPQAGTARTVLAPVASVLAGDNTPVQFAGDVTTGQRWPVLPEASETPTPLSASDSSLVSSPTAGTSSAGTSSARISPAPSTPPATTPSLTASNASSAADREAQGARPARSAQAPNTTREPSQEITVTPTTATPRSAPTTPPPRTSALAPTPRVVPTTAGSTTEPTTTTRQQSSATSTFGATTPAVGEALSATSTAVDRSDLPGERTNLQAIKRTETVNLQANAEQPARQSPETSTRGVAASLSSQKAEVHVVAPGESFWAIAEQHLLAHNPKADDHAIARYWEELQAQNAHRLPAPGVPDLLFPGTELSLPPITG